MKIYTKVVIHIETGAILQSESFEYHGEVALCGSGGGGTNTSTVVSEGDKTYNAGLFELARGDAKTADEYDNFFRYGTFYDPTEKKQAYKGSDGNLYEVGSKLPDGVTNTGVVSTTLGEIHGYDDDSTVSGLDYATQAIGAQSRLLPSEEAAALSGNQSTTAQNILNTATANAGLSLVDPAAQLAKSDIEQGIAFNAYENQERGGQNALTMAKLSGQTEAMPLYFDEAINGVNVNERMNQAQGDVIQADKNSTRTMRQRAAMTGINPSGESFAAGMNNDALNLTRNIASARGTAKTNAENEKFARLQGALTL